MAIEDLIEVQNKLLQELVKELSEIADAIQSLEETILSVGDVPATRKKK